MLFRAVVTRVLIPSCSPGRVVVGLNWTRNSVVIVYRVPGYRRYEGGAVVGENIKERMSEDEDPLYLGYANPARIMCGANIHPPNP